MSFRAGVVVLVVAVVSPAAADDGMLRVRTERRLELLSALRKANASPRVCQTIAELTHAMPPSAVLSRLAFSRKPGRWELALSQGSKADAEAIVGRLVTKGLCTSPTVAVDGAGFTAACTVPEAPVRVLLKAPDKRAKAEPAGSMDRDRDESAQTELPDAPDMKEYDLSAHDLATQSSVSAFTWTARPAPTGAAIDRFELAASGTAAFAGAAGFVCGLGNLRRLTSINAFEFRNPRVRNGDWAVDFTLRGSTWRYRREDEKKEINVELEGFADAPKLEFLDILRSRTPFGLPGPVFAGSKRTLTGKECRTQGTAVATPIDAELDTYSVAFLGGGAAPACAMLVDEKGACHELKLNAPLGQGFKVSRIDAGGITLARYEMTPVGKMEKYELVLKGPGTVTPPPWFCPAK